MGGPKFTAQRLDGKGARKDGRSSSTMVPKQSPQGEQAKWSGKPMNLKVDVENLEPPSPHTFSTSPIEKHMVNAQTPRSTRRNSGSSFLQPDQFIAELKVKTGADNRSELSFNDSPGSARSTRSTGSATSVRSFRSSNEPRNGAAAWEQRSPHLRKSPKSHLSDGNGNGNIRVETQPFPQGTQAATNRETMSRRVESGVHESPTSQAKKGSESLYEPANSVPTLELAYEGKPAPAPAHLRVKAGTGTAHSTNSTAQPGLDKNSEEILGKFSAPELQKSSSQGSGRFFKGPSPALLKLQATSALLAGSCSPATMRDKLVRSVSGKKDSSSREGDSRTVHSFHAGMSAKPHSQPVRSQPILSQPLHSQPAKPSHEKPMNEVEGNAVKPAGRLRRMLHWGASKTGLEVLKSLERKLDKKSSKVGSGSKNEKMGGGKDGSKSEPTEARIDVEREIREVSERVEKVDPEIFDDGNWSPRSASSVSTTYSDVSTKSHSHKHSHHKKNVKSEAVKSKLWLLRVHQKKQGRPSKESEEDGIYEAVRGATFHGIPDSTFKDVDKKPLPGSARFNLEKNAITKLVAKHKRNSTWDAGKLSPNDHLFSPKQPRLPKSDAHILLAPPKKLTGNTGETEFQRRRGKPSTLNTQSGSTNLEVTNKSSSPRTANAPVAPEQQVATSGNDARSNLQTTTSTSTRQGQTQQGVALPASPSSGTFLQTAALVLTSPGRAESVRSPKSSVHDPVSPARSELVTPPISPGTMPTSSRSSFGSFKGFNSPLPLPVRVGTVGPQSSPSSPIYAASTSPRQFASSPTADKMQSTPTSPGLSLGWTDTQNPTSPGVHGASPFSPGASVTAADGAGFQNSLIAGLDATSRTSPRGQGSDEEEIFVLANSSFDSTSSSNSSVVPVSAVKHPATRGTQQGARIRSRSASIVGKNGVNGSRGESESSVSDERERSDKRKTATDNVLALPASPRPLAVTFEQIVAGRGRSPPTDNTLMKFFFKCREIEHLNKFLALQKKRFLESLNTDSEKCFHMILSEAGKGLSSMISTFCTAWLLENTKASASVKWHPVPVMNMSQNEMWQHRDAAWLFHVCGVEANAVLFLDEITSNNETAIAGRVKQAVAGQDILVTKDEVVSSCTIVSEKFRQEAPKLLQARYMKTLLLAGILVDTKNLSTGSSRDKQQATILLVGAGSLGRNGFYKHLVNIRDENYVTTFIKEIYGDSKALTGEKSAQRGQGVERPKSLSASSQTDEKPVRPPPSRPAPLRPPPLAIPNVRSEVPASISPTTPPVPLPKPTTALSRKPESEVKLSRKSEVETKLSRKSEVEAKPNHKSDAEAKWNSKPVSEAKNDDSSKVSSNKKEGASQTSKSSFGLRRFRNRSSV
ncbi:hypothetical protein KC19_1G248500 [Ceratodon purpureus]|uniref:Uncharacterized protein n=1 Tax=Ceratodon purpureus TaxID=3225 RepID=A0A8T0JBL7_CERPU|nr:hypothetical protein KC19_1G248500 [Ceratodon purpureus]